ncbi:iron complex outermembrane receptor protein [Sphingomonas zeicaulis]|uniref:TonB-dependent receptor n=1 Tax=Sphingomonas zeicaulis TaxID=1632740 RepID=UPI003D202F13
MKGKSACFRVSVAMATLSVAGTAGAQQNEGDAYGIQDIVVTAQKRAESMQDVPIAITAIGSEQLEQRGITGLANLQLTPPPGLFAQPFAGDPTLLIIDMRGVVNTDPGQGTIESGTAVYLDDIYLGRSQGSGVELADPERIEVLRGPQGTLFGRNAEGGAIRIVSKKPTGSLGGTLRGQVGNFGRLRGEAHINLPEIAGFKIKLDYLNNQLDGYTRNGAARLDRLSSQRRFGYQDAEGYRGSVRWEATPDITIDYAYDWIKQKIATDYYVLDRPIDPPYPANAPSQYFAPRADESVNEYERRSSLPLYLDTFDTKSRGHTLQGEFVLSDAITIRSITGYRKLDTAGRGQLGEAFVAQDFASIFGAPPGTPVGLPIEAFTPVDGGSFGLPAGTTVYGFSGVVPDARLRQRQFSQEFQLVGTAGDFEYTLGAYYFHEKVTDTRQSLFSIMYVGPGVGTFRITDPQSVNPFALPFPGQGPTAQSATTDSFAGFAQVTWSPAFAQDRLHITGGLRYTDDKKKFLRFLLGGSAVDIEPEPFEESRFDPAFTLAYDIADRVNVYAKYSQAYRAGGVSLRSPNFVPFGAEVNKAVEVGLKSEFLDRRLRLNISAFQNRISNRQLGIQTDPLDPAVTDTINAPGITRVRGIETELTLAPTPGLTFNFNYAYQTAKQPSFATIDPNASFYLTNTPRHALSVAGDYVIPLGMGNAELALHADYALTSDIFGSVRVANDNFAWDTKRDVANARIGVQNIEVGEFSFRIAGFANNVFDTAYPTYTAPGANAILLPPRTYGLELGINF